MGPEEAALALELLGTKRCVPCHYGTFPPLKGTPAELRELAPDVQVDDAGAGRLGHGMRERWWGGSGRRVPELAVEGDPARAGRRGARRRLVARPAGDPRGVRRRHARSSSAPSSPEDVRAALARPEVASVLVPEDRRDLLELDLTELTYGVSRSSRRTRSPPATSRRSSGASRCSRSSSRSARSSRGRSRRSARSRRRRTRTRATARTGSRSSATGLSASEVVERLTAADEGRAERQLGVVDGKGRSASWTGPECNDWAGHRNGPCYAAQGNILVGAETVDALATTFEANAAAAARAAPARVPRRRAGSRRRPARPAVRLAPRRPARRRLRRAVRHPRRPPRRRSRAADRGAAPHLRPPPPPVRGSARARTGCRSRASCAPRSTSGSRRLGYDSLDAWAGVENLEERVDGEDAIDPVVLDALREATA